MELTLLEQLNLAVFSLMNATPSASPLEINVAIFIAKYLVYLFPLSLAFYWLWGNEKHIDQQRTLACKAGVALIIALSISWFIGMIAPHDRPLQPISVITSLIMRQRLPSLVIMVLSCLLSHWLIFFGITVNVLAC